MLPEWRRIQLDFRVAFGYNEKSCNEGYVVESYVLLRGHETCGCTFSRTAVKIGWFLPHSPECHGEYPAHYERMNELREQLIRETPWLEIGVQLFPSVSYGNLVKQ